MPTCSPWDDLSLSAMQLCFALLCFLLAAGPRLSASRNMPTRICSVSIARLCLFTKEVHSPFINAMTRCIF